MGRWQRGTPGYRGLREWQVVVWWGDGRSRVADRRCWRDGLVGVEVKEGDDGEVTRLKKVSHNQFSRVIPVRFIFHFIPLFFERANFYLCAYKEGWQSSDFYHFARWIQK
jgi:hypothetical protein